ncbi:polysaccharide biosynthesis tyrosine autokinase [Vibrio ponticus]|uniref:non-specific protein-tyrosine kinase n=2 Tax=Vibrio ponticus TaxID=265668 RepID=A0A3N3DQQ2_9VIBR|nr:polysaccharide biosynthesis tyrosine autokinase [Vibrio ponticus]ROV56759.1 polysaccharide biosynthesis tyrosine autokinase [Vibrio ponticus]
MLNNFQTGQVEKEKIIDIGYYFHLVKKRWLSVLLFSVFCTITSIFAAMSIKPTYKATATLLIESSQKNAISIEEVVGIDTSAKEYYLTQFEILKSNQVAQRVIEKLALESHPEFISSTDMAGSSLIKGLVSQIKMMPLVETYFSRVSTQDTIDRDETAHTVNQNVLKRFKASMTITPIRKTQLVKISFESRDPKLAALVANEIGLAYIENNLDSKLMATEQATGWINDRLASLKQQLDASEQALLDFLKQQELIDNRGISALTSSELSNLTERLANATSKRIEAQSLYYALKSNQNTDISSVASISLISNHPQIRDIRNAEADAEKQVSELSKRYGPKHDKMIQAKAQLASIQLRANKLVEKLIEGIRKELVTAREQESLLKNELMSKKAEFQTLSVVEREYDALKREVDSNAKLYDLFLTRQKETSATSDFSSTNARFSDYALVPELPFKPNRGLIVALGLLGSLMLSAGLIITLDVFNNRIDSSRDFENKLGLLPTGTIPMIRDRKYRNAPLDVSIFKSGQFNIFQESVDSIRTSIYLAIRGTNRKVLAVSSSIPEEGKTTTAISLAHSMSKLERVLLIDADLRRPSVADRFGLSCSHKGLTNILLMNSSIEESISSFEDGKLDVLTAGMVVAKPQEILSSRAFEELIEKLSQSYDRIIIDIPPILPVKDAFIVGKIAKGILLVMKASSTSKSVYKHAMNLVSRHGIPIDGVILNQVHVRKEGKHTYSEYSLQSQTNS